MKIESPLVHNRSLLQKHIPLILRPDQIEFFQKYKGNRSQWVRIAIDQKQEREKADPFCSREIEKEPGVRIFGGLVISEVHQAFFDEYKALGGYPSRYIRKAIDERIESQYQQKKPCEFAVNPDKEA